MPAPAPADDPFARRRAGARAELRRFAELIDRAERLRANGLDFDELRELVALYRSHAARLAVARDRDTDPDAVRTLNALCTRAYAALFTDSAQRARRPWPQALRAAFGQTWRAQLVAWALLVAGMLLGGGLTWHDPLAVHALVPSGMGYSPDQLDELVASAAAREQFFAVQSMPVGWKAVFGSFLFANNTRVGLIAFAAGMLAGIPTILLTLYNGIVLGAFASIFLHDPWPLDFLAWILPHGVPELTAIVLCAAGGLQLGAAVAMPGPRGRAVALAEAVPPVLMLFAAAVPLFVLAAVIESFVRQSTWGPTPRLAIAALWIAGAVALVFAARRADRETADTSWLRELA
jgi:uncharacterized membrane protein SpoIIM required for sporulation